MPTRHRRRIRHEDLLDLLDRDEGEAGVVVLDGRDIAALAHWARVGLEHAFEDAKTVELAAASDRADEEGALFTFAGFREAARRIRESAERASDALALLESADLAVLSVDPDRSGDTGGFT